MDGNGGLFHELKRRHVWRVAIAYVIVAWLLIQVVTQVFPVLHMPLWTTRFVVLLLLLGFPLVVVVSWAFEFTPQGIRRTESTPQAEPRADNDRHAIGDGLHAWAIGVLAVVVAIVGWRVYAPRSPAAAPEPVHAVSSAATVAVAARNVSRVPDKSPSQPAVVPAARSIAVLPFENLSANKENEYFVAGMQDLILTRLAGIGDLKVISRTSTLKYKSRPDNLKQIASELGVATVLEGSVQRQADQVLISVQLIEAGSDTHLWAETYQRKLDSIFGVEGEVAQKVADALKARLSPIESAQLAAIPTHDRDAYDLFLRAEYLLGRGLLDFDNASLKNAIDLYDGAVGKDPAFALAFARKSYAESMLGRAGGNDTPIETLFAQGRVDAERALALAPGLAASHIAMGYSKYFGHNDYKAATQSFERALRLRPNDLDALTALALIERRVGRIDQSLLRLRQVLQLDPRNAMLMSILAETLMMASSYDEARVWCGRALATDPANAFAVSQEAAAIMLSGGDVPTALAKLQGNTSWVRATRANAYLWQRQYAQALAALKDIPASDFDISRNKTLFMAQMYRLLGDTIHAKNYFEQTLTQATARTRKGSTLIQSWAWSNVAGAQIGLGHHDAALAAIAKSMALIDPSGDHVDGPQILYVNAGYYAQAGRTDLALPLLARALNAPGIGLTVSPYRVSVDPAWDSIRHDPRFMALMRTHLAEKRTS